MYLKTQAISAELKREGDGGAELFELNVLGARFNFTITLLIKRIITVHHAKHIHYYYFFFF